ncbi:MAG: pyridoxal phosphate-dependent aminotransferase [Phycisphaerales bacterium]
MKNVPIQPARRIGDLNPYAPPARDPRITLSLDNNEGAPIDASIMDVLRGIDPETLARYPDQSALEAQIAVSLSIDSSRVVITNGGDDAIDRVCRAILNPGDAMLTHAPGFVMIPRWAQLAGAANRMIEWLEGEFPRDAFLGAIDDSVRLVSLISPCNPSGAIVPTGDILAIAEKCQSVGAVLMLDQAYIEFADEDPIGSVLGLENVVIVRTFSKAMGGAGLRVGYAIAPEPIATWMRTVGGPYPVSSLSIAIAGAVYKRRGERASIIQQTRANRSKLIQQLRSQGVPVLESQANFILARFDSAAGTHAQLLEQGISVRRFRTGSGIDRYLRITVPANAAQLNQLLDALSAIGAAP